MSVVSNSMRPHRRQPTRPPNPWDSPGKNTGVGCHFLLQCIKVKSDSEVVQSCPTLSDPMDCSLPGSSVHGILQARVLEWGAVAFSALTLGSINSENSHRGNHLNTRLSITQSPVAPCAGHLIQTTNKANTQPQSSAYRIISSLSLAHQRKANTKTPHKAHPTRSLHKPLDQP